MGTKTLLNGVNDVFKATQVIAGDSGVLTSLTDSGRQHYIDVAVRVWNQAILRLYNTAALPLPDEQAESTITLATDDRDYALPSDLVRLRFPLIDKTNNQFIHEFPGGYNRIIEFDAEQDDTGLPHWAAIRPTDGELFLDRKPTASENGNVYTFQYDKSIAVSGASDTFPFRDEVYEALIPAVAELWRRRVRRESDDAILISSLGEAASMMTQTQPRTTWFPR